MRRLGVLLLIGSLFLGLSSRLAYAKSHTLFQRLGGRKGIANLVHDFITRCGTDDRIRSFFAATVADNERRGKFESKLTDQICQASGGSCKYRGKPMKVAHEGMGIQGEHFDAMVENLTASLNQFHVPPADQKALLAKLAPMKKDIVEPVRSTASQPK